MAYFNPEFDLKDFRIPDYILVPGSEVEAVSYVPECPVIVFINSKSSGQLGGDLLITYQAPDESPSRIYVNLEKLKIIVAGGDGIAGWLLGIVSDLKLSWPPPIATVPLGTGNNLLFSFGWGKKNPGTDSRSVESFLGQHILIRVKASKGSPCDPIAPLELPYSLHAFHRVSETDSLNIEVSYAFHTEQKLHPEKFTNQLVNQRTYARLGCAQGWFAASLFHPASQTIAQVAKISVMKKAGGQWEGALSTISSIRAERNCKEMHSPYNPLQTTSIPAMLLQREEMGTVDNPKHKSRYPKIPCSSKPIDAELSNRNINSQANSGKHWRPLQHQGRL
ncbi:hypothetical protein PVL29_027277 [Vitis rotundifolia]|uniref:DAGKc domain-containing protein n=1 Tax=Vitis rotundifolia TaxID=103349 RepID=A0AA39D6P2_VITRO|nr:hypothetical protein PVL29_027277 [Vitis rotundifolia]